MTVFEELALMRNVRGRSGRDKANRRRRVGGRFPQSSQPEGRRLLPECAGEGEPLPRFQG